MGELPLQDFGRDRHTTIDPREGDDRDATDFQWLACGQACACGYLMYRWGDFRELLDVVSDTG